MPQFLRIFKASIPAVIVVFLCATVCWAQPQKPHAPLHVPAPAGKVIATTLQAEVPQGKPCPLTVRFVGSITTNGAADVKFTWVSFDGGTWPERTLHFSEKGTQRVGESREIFVSGTGWMQLKVLSPNAVVSRRALYRVTCPQPPATGKKRR